MFADTTLTDAATTFARTLGRSLQTVWVLYPKRVPNWNGFRVVRGEDTRCVLDPHLPDPRHPMQYIGDCLLFSR